LEQCQGSFLGAGTVLKQWWRVAPRATVTGGALVHAPPLELQNNKGSVTASPLLPLTGSENHCHLQKEKNTQGSRF